MPPAFTTDEIRGFWTAQATQHGEAAAASWSDVRVMEMEIREISTRVTDGDRILDVGCANGFSTLQLARIKRVDILGIDYIPEMINSANRQLQTFADSLVGKVRFETGDASNIPAPSNSFDKVISIRVIINLGAWPSQLAALRECVRVLRPGGTLLLSEATLQGWQRLNDLRAEWGLSPIPVPGFNNYLDERQVCEALADQCEFHSVSNFASTYYVGTRVLKPLLARLADREDQTANPLCELNTWFSLLPAAGDYGTQKLFLFTKRV
jgi:ubiquinone/menaquinone biosynthesis C-methylase UbiE